MPALKNSPFVLIIRDGWGLNPNPSHDAFNAPLIAHSRGTDVTTTALRELNIEYKAAGKETRKELKLGNLVLCAADLDIDVVSQG